MEVHCFTVGEFFVNTYVIRDEPTGYCAIVDTGESRQLVDILKKRRFDIQMILLTHTHLDHAGALTYLQEEWDVPTYMPRADRSLFETLPIQGTMFVMPHLNRPCGRIDHEIDDGAEIQLGETTLKFLATPGHTPGQGCYYNDTDIIVGDTLFAGSIGRTDFPLSDPQEMVESLRRLTRLSAHLRVHSGHGPTTTIGHELKTNPFLGFIRKERGIDGPPGVKWTRGI